MGCSKPAARASRLSRAGKAGGAPRPQAESRRAGWSTLRVGSLVPPRPRNARLALVGTSGRDRGGSAGRPRPAPANHYHSCRYNLGPAGRAATRPLHRPDSASADGLPEVQRGATRPNRFPRGSRRDGRYESGRQVAPDNRRQRQWDGAGSSAGQGNLPPGQRAEIVPAHRVRLRAPGRHGATAAAVGGLGKKTVDSRAAAAR